MRFGYNRPMKKEPIYIQEIELINFESHKHTVLKDFSRGFNCLAGKSDVGKSSILRAIKLCAYNEFSQEIVRLGAKFCEVKVTTNIGSVHVVRGKGHNKWTIIRNDFPTPIEFDKIGKSEVKEACEVLGIKMIKLGDNDIPVNIMDQLESHFFLSSVGGEKTSGSTRAEIIDEICGLNGVEELVKTISLDQYRLTREITVAEERIKELSSKLFSETDIQRDTEILANLDLLQFNIETCQGNLQYVSGILDELGKDKRISVAISEQLSLLPDIDKADRLIKHTKDVSRRLRDALAIRGGIETCSLNLNRIKRDLALIPDVSGIQPLFSEARKTIGSILHAQGISEFIEGFRTALEKTKKELEALPKADASLKIAEAKKAVQCYQETKQTLSEIRSLKEKKEKIEKELALIPSFDYEEIEKKVKAAFLEREKVVLAKKDIDALLVQGKALRAEIETVDHQREETERQIAELMKKIDVCPVTKKPIGETCSLWNGMKQG